MSNLFSELKRRNVFKVAIAYLVVGWLAIQVVVSVTEPLNLPAWVPSFVIVLLAIGFPIALLFAWAFELTPDGVKKTADVAADSSITQSTSRKIDFIIIGALVLIIGGLVYNGKFTSPSKKPLTVSPQEEAAPPSIAVLAFDDFSPNKDQEYFADGISDEILNLLVKTNAMRVTGRTSSFSFKGKDDDIPSIANKLNVKHVLEGSISKSGNRLKITAQLNDANGVHIWSETYKRELTDIFEIQEEIAAAIIRELKAKLIGGNQTIKASGTTNMEAHKALLQAKYALAKRGNDSAALFDAIGLFRLATKLDPNYADAHAGLSRAMTVSVNFGIIRDSQTQLKLASIAAKDALKIDPDNIEALVSSGLIKFMYIGDFDGAEQDFKRAITLAPFNAEAHNFHGDYLRSVMDFEKALIIERRSAELDPLNGINISEQAQVLVKLGRSDEGIQMLSKAIEKAPDDAYLFYSLYILYENIGELAKAQEVLEKTVERWPNNPLFIKNFLFFKARRGDEDTLNTIIDQQNNADFQNHYLGRVAEVYLYLGDYDRATIWLDKLYNNGINYYQQAYITIADPRKHVVHKGLNEVLSRPGFKEFIELRRKNLGLDQEDEQ